MTLWAMHHMLLARINVEVTATVKMFSAFLISCSDVITVSVVVGLPCPALLPSNLIPHCWPTPLPAEFDNLMLLWETKDYDSLFSFF